MLVIIIIIIIIIALVIIISSRVVLVFYSAYCQLFNLFFGAHTLLSQEGSQQGNPLGLLLFCNAI